MIITQYQHSNVLAMNYLGCTRKYCTFYSTTKILPNHINSPLLLDENKRLSIFV